jgi:hypothetical protein
MKNSISLKAIDETKDGKALNDTEVKAVFDFSEDISTALLSKLSGASICLKRVCKAKWQNN